jgi:predicted methyltransferase
VYLLAGSITGMMWQDTAGPREADLAARASEQARTVDKLMDIPGIAAEVAAAVGLAEGDSGVRDILLVVARSEPVATNQIGRMAELPVPIVTAVCNELRKRGVIDKTRPVRLTASARAAIADDGGHLDPQCPCCAGLGLRIPDELSTLSDALEADAAGAPQARMELDQTHCTVPTKVRRVLKLHQVGALAGRSIVLLGDDDLIAIAIARFASMLGIATGRLAVVDTDPAVLSWIGAQVDGTGIDVELVEHDLRSPLPSSLAGTFDVACTDPPYTVPGAELFLSRAVSALAGRPGEHVFFSFGPRRPAESLATQRLIADLGLVVRSVTPGFNSYLGAGILAGTSHLYHLRTGTETAPLIDGEYLGPLYTADTRTGQSRPYRCTACGSAYLVGRAGPEEPAPEWSQIRDLQSAGCPACGGTTFRPMPRAAR